MSHRLSNFIAGIEFDFPTPCGSRGRGLVASDVLVQRYRCPNTPAGWMNAFAARQADLESEAAELERFTPLDSRFTMLVFETTGTHSPQQAAASEMRLARPRTTQATGRPTLDAMASVPATT